MGIFYPKLSKYYITRINFNLIHMNIKIFAALLSVSSNMLLVIIKLLIAKMSGSVAIASEAIHSAIDLLASCIASIGVLVSSEPADKNHQYGHAKFENIAATIEGILIILAAIWIIYEALQKLFNLQPITKIDLGILVMGGSALINLLISNYLIKTGNKTESVALIADGWHLRTDVYTSIGVMLSLMVVLVGQLLWKDVNLFWLDPVAGIVLAGFIMKVAYNLIIQASSDLVDISLPEFEVNWIIDYLQSLVPATVHGFHSLKTRKAGTCRFIELHVIVDGNMTVASSYQIVSKIIQSITEHFVGSYVVIQIEPYKT